MRKRLVKHHELPASSLDDWLDLASLAQVEVTSEDPTAQIEGALTGNGPEVGWRAADPGEQVIRILLDESQRIRRIYLRFVERVNETHTGICAALVQ